MREFTKFHCMVSDRDEDFDNDIQMYFVKEYELADITSNLIKLDAGFSDNYKKIVNYIMSLENFIIMGEKTEDFQFLKNLPLEKGWKDDYTIILSDNRAAKVAFRACTKVIEVLYYYRKLSREEYYRNRFTPENFEALLLLRDIFYKRSSDLIKN